jgi:hypothetical protein
MSLEQIHIARDTDGGVEALCGRVEVFAIYPKQLIHYSDEDVCSECKQAHGMYFLKVREAALGPVG